jgi:DNA-binding MarR family transcriptional regulator
MKRLYENEIKNIISLYKEGFSPKEIGEKLGIYNNSVTRILRKRGIERNQAAPRITPEQTKYIIEQYQLGINSEELGRQLKIDSCTVLRILKRNNITVKSNSESKRQFELDETILDNIDSEEKAYFLGLLYSDGNVSKKNNDISIRLLSKDKEVLQQLSNYFYGQDRITIAENKKKQEIATFRMVSKKLKQRLIEIGCPPNKTFIIKYPENLDPSLDRHFIRGVIDGDGSVFDYKSPTISVTGTENLLFKMSEIIEQNLNIKCKIAKRLDYRLRDVNILDISYRGYSKFKILGEWIYNDATIKMQRKYDNYIAAKDKQSDAFFSLEEEKIIIDEFLSEKSFGEIAKNHDEYYSNIKKIIERNVPHNYGSTNIINYKNNLLTKEYINSLSIAERQEVQEYLFHYFRGYGLPCPKYSDFQLHNDWQNIKSFDSSTILDGNKLKSENDTGIKLIQHFFENIYDISFNKNLSIMDLINNNKILNKSIESILGIYSGKTLDISGATFRQELINCVAEMPTNMFSPVVSKYIYDTYAEKDGIVYDYSSGFGQRLIGAMASKNNLQYIGADPWTASFENLNKLYRYIFQHHRCNIHNIGSENFYQEDLNEKICLAFSSPPYFDTEIYCKEKTQCNLSSYEDYLNYWDKTCLNTSKILKSNGYFIVNISDKYKDDLVKIASKYFKYDHELYLSYENDKNEPIIIMKK